MEFQRACYGAKLACIFCGQRTDKVLAYAEKPGDRPRWYKICLRCWTNLVTYVQEQTRDERAST